MPKTEVNQMLAVAAAACEEKQAQDIRILALDPVESGLADYFLICNGTNDRQNVAITDEIEIRLKREFGNYPASVEGRRHGDWILMDYVDFIVHVFSPEKRAFYGLERLRKSATTLSVDDLNAEIKAAITSKRRKPAEKEAEVTSKPAKGEAAKGETLAARKVASKTVTRAAKSGSKTVAESATKRATKATTKVASKVAGKKAAAKKPAATKRTAKKAAGQ